MNRLFLLLVALGAGWEAQAEMWLGDAPQAPVRTPAAASFLLEEIPSVNGGFTVDTSSREQTRSFYNAVYLSSEGIPINSTVAFTNCEPGTNNPAFIDAVLRRINWFRAMAGLPAAVTFDPAENTQCQAAALIMSTNNTLAHTGITPAWHCFSTAGTNAAAHANLALGSCGPEAITGYIQDFGTNNQIVGHRRWILYPQTQVMATGDIPAGTGYNAANATWIFDGNIFGPRPATRTAFVAWPPAGFVPLPVVFPRWSFALPDADFSVATVNLRSNGVSVAVSKEPYATGAGENTLVWYPTGLNPNSEFTVFPFSGTDTVYSVTVSNVITGQGNQNYSYNVTVFDPAKPGSGTVVTAVSGTNQPTVNADNQYTCPPVPDPNLTGYQWLVAQTNNGNFFDGAEGGTLTNFTVVTSGGYSMITNSSASGQTGNKCFYLAMPVPEDQVLQLNQRFLPQSNTAISFKSLLGYATTNQVARVQVSTNEGTAWLDLYSQAGTGGAGENTFTLRSLSLTNFAGQPVRLRFVYDFWPVNPNYFQQVLTNPPVGWFLDNLTVTNTLALINPLTNATPSTNFNFVPYQKTNYLLQARAVIFNQFPLDWGPLKSLTSVTSPPVIVLASPVMGGSQVQVPFSVSGGPATIFQLLSAPQPNGSWVTNTLAGLTTNTAGRAYTFATTNGPGNRFYRVKAR